MPILDDDTTGSLTERMAPVAAELLAELAESRAVLEAAREAEARIADGVVLLRSDGRARLAFALDGAVWNEERALDRLREMAESAVRVTDLVIPAGTDAMEQAEKPAKKTAAKKAGGGKPTYGSIDEVPREMLETYERLGIPLNEQKALANVAVDAVFDSVSVATTHQQKLYDAGVVFCSFAEAVRHMPELVERWLGSVVPTADNYFAALNSAVFSDGSFVYIPPYITCPLELSTYFRINNTEAGQFERTMISYLEGCTAPKSSKHQLHAAVVELVALDDADGGDAPDRLPHVARGELGGQRA